MLDDMQKGINSAIIVAAGSGSRFGSQIPKQFLLLNGVEVLAWSVHAFLNHPAIAEVIIVTSQPYLEGVKSRYPDCQVVLGGSTRQESVFNGLSAINTETEIALVHDAARPIIPDHIIDACLQKLGKFDGVAPAITPADSMVKIEADGFSNLNRAELRIVQTPQCFKASLLKNAHTTGIIDTDEMGLVKQAFPSARLGFVEGVPDTMKITSASDLKMVEMYLRARSS